jgi:hypothetical protein
MLDQVVETIAAAGVVASLLFVGWQTRELSKQTRINSATSTTSVFAGCAQLMANVHGPILTKPELRAYFYEGKRCLPGDEHERLLHTMAELFADAAEYCLMAAKHTEDATGWTRYPVDLVESSPVLREVVSTRPGWWPMLTAIVDQYHSSITHSADESAADNARTAAVQA